MEVNILNIIWFVLLGLGIILILIRMMKGPGIANRVMGLDTLTTVTTSLIIIISLLTDNNFFLDIALVYAILAFSSVLIIARYMEKGV